MLNKKLNQEIYRLNKVVSELSDKLKVTSKELDNIKKLVNKNGRDVAAKISKKMDNYLLDDQERVIGIKKILSEFKQEKNQVTERLTKEANEIVRKLLRDVDWEGQNTLSVLFEVQKSNKEISDIKERVSKLEDNKKD